MSTLTTYDKVSRLIEYATGERHGDGYIVTDVISGYAEPGYPSGDDVVIVLGDWNDKIRYVDGVREVLDDFPSRLARSLERVGAELEWLDEWYSCSGCFRAVRSTENSYHWKPAYLWTDNGPVCHECAIGDGEDALTAYGDEREGYINNPQKCVTWCEPEHVESFGFVKWEPGNPQTYENGWHPGQTDDPKVIFDVILEAHPTAEVIFFLDESSQFYVRFSAYVRIPDAAEEDES